MMLPGDKTRRLLAWPLAIGYFLSQVVLGHAAETNIWSDRRRQIEQQRRPVTLARLPHLPSPGLGGSVPPQNSRFSAPENFPKGVGRIFQRVPAEAVNIKKIVSSSRRSTQTVIHIQDVHMNGEAQANISRALRGLMDGEGVDLIALEGAFGPIPLSGFRAIPEKSFLQEASDFLLRENGISGAVHAALTNAGPVPPVVGVDDRALHAANVEAYKNASPRRHEFERLLNEAKARLAHEKKLFFSQELIAFDEKMEAYRQGTLPFGPYVEYLSSLAKPEKSYPTAHLFLRAWRMESQIDFERTDAERLLLVERLSSLPDVNHSRKLLSFSMEYRLGKMRHADFYAQLKSICKSAGVSLADYPAMDAYIRYVLISDRLQSETLFKELLRLEKKHEEHLARSPREKELLRVSRAVFLAEKLSEFSLTPGEWTEYKSVVRDLPFSWEGRAPFEAFYEKAMARDKAMAGHLVQAMADNGASTVVLVTGGFHAPGIESALQHAGMHVVSITPKITSVENDAATSLSVFAREKTPLGKIFEGQRLFLAAHPANRITDLPCLLGGLMVKSGIGHEATAARVKSLFEGILHVTSVKIQRLKARIIFKLDVDEPPLEDGSDARYSLEMSFDESKIQNIVPSPARQPFFGAARPGHSTVRNAMLIAFILLLAGILYLMITFWMFSFTVIALVLVLLYVSAESLFTRPLNGEESRSLENVVRSINEKHATDGSASAAFNPADKSILLEDQATQEKVRLIVNIVSAGFLKGFFRDSFFDPHEGAWIRVKSIVLASHELLKTEDLARRLLAYLPGPATSSALSPRNLRFPLDASFAVFTFIVVSLNAVLPNPNNFPWGIDNLLSVISWVAQLSAVVFMVGIIFVIRYGFLPSASFSMPTALQVRQLERSAEAAQGALNAFFAGRRQATLLLRPFLKTHKSAGYEIVLSSLTNVEGFKARALAVSVKRWTLYFSYALLSWMSQDSVKSTSGFFFRNILFKFVDFSSQDRLDYLMTRSVFDLLDDLHSTPHHQPKSEEILALEKAVARIQMSHGWRAHMGLEAKLAVEAGKGPDGRPGAVLVSLRSPQGQWLYRVVIHRGLLRRLWRFIAMHRTSRQETTGYQWIVIPEKAFRQGIAGTDRYISNAISPALTRFQRPPPNLPLASIFDSDLRESGWAKNHPTFFKWFYPFYNGVLVNWEGVFQFPVYLILSVGGPEFFLLALSANFLQAVAFGLAHGKLSLPRRIWIGFVGFLLGSVYLIAGRSQSMDVSHIGFSLFLHTTYNVLAPFLGLPPASMIGNGYEAKWRRTVSAPRKAGKKKLNRPPPEKWRHLARIYLPESSAVSSESRLTRILRQTAPVQFTLAFIFMAGLLQKDNFISLVEPWVSPARELLGGLFASLYKIFTNYTTTIVLLGLPWVVRIIRKLRKPKVEPPVVSVTVTNQGDVFAHLENPSKFQHGLELLNTIIQSDQVANEIKKQILARLLAFWQSPPFELDPAREAALRLPIAHLTPLVQANDPLALSVEDFWLTELDSRASEHATRQEIMQGTRMGSVSAPGWIVEKANVYGRFLRTYNQAQRMPTRERQIYSFLEKLPGPHTSKFLEILRSEVTILFFSSSRTPGFRPEMLKKGVPYTVYHGAVDIDRRIVLLDSSGPVVFNAWCLVRLAPFLFSHYALETDQGQLRFGLESAFGQIQRDFIWTLFKDAVLRFRLPQRWTFSHLPFMYLMGSWKPYAYGNQLFLSREIIQGSAKIGLQNLIRRVYQEKFSKNKPIPKGIFQLDGAQSTGTVSLLIASSRLLKRLVRSSVFFFAVGFQLAIFVPAILAPLRIVWLMLRDLPWPQIDWPSFPLIRFLVDLFAKLAGWLHPLLIFLSPLWALLAAWVDWFVAAFQWVYGSFYVPIIHNIVVPAAILAGLPVGFMAFVILWKYLPDAYASFFHLIVRFFFNKFKQKPPRKSFEVIRNLVKIGLVAFILRYSHVFIGFLFFPFMMPAENLKIIIEINQAQQANGYPVPIFFNAFFSGITIGFVGGPVLLFLGTWLVALGTIVRIAVRKGRSVSGSLAKSWIVAVGGALIVAFVAVSLILHPIKFKDDPAPPAPVETSVPTAREGQGLVEFAALITAGALLSWYGILQGMLGPVLVVGAGVFVLFGLLAGFRRHSVRLEAERDARLFHDILSSRPVSEKSLNVLKIPPSALLAVESLADPRRLALTRRLSLRAEKDRAYEKVFREQWTKLGEVGGSVTAQEIVERLTLFSGSSAQTNGELLRTQIHWARTLQRPVVIQVSVRDTAGLESFLAAQEAENAAYPETPVEIYLVPGRPELRPQLLALGRPGVRVTREAFLFNGDGVRVDALDGAMRAEGVDLRNVTILSVLPEGCWPDPESFGRLPSDSPYNDKAIFMMLGALSTWVVAASDFRQLIQLSLLVAQQA